MNIDFLCKDYGEFYYFKCYVMWEAYQMLPIAHWPVRVQGNGEDMPSIMLSFINFEPLELYWTYFLAPQTTTPKIPPMRLMSLDHKPKMRCCAMSLNYELWWDNIAMGYGPWALASFCEYGLFLGLKRDFVKLHDSVDVVRVANEIKPCGVKNLSSTKVRLQWIKRYTQ